MSPSLLKYISKEAYALAPPYNQKWYRFSPLFFDFVCWLKVPLGKSSSISVEINIHTKIVKKDHVSSVT